MKRARWIWVIVGLPIFTCLFCCSGYRFLPFLPYHLRQSYFDTWTDEAPFDREAWLNKTTTDNCAYPGVHYRRGMMIDDLNQKYGLDKMKQWEIRKLLGPPDGHRQLKDGLSLWEYELGVWNRSEGNYLSLIFNGEYVQAQSYDKLEDYE